MLDPNELGQFKEDVIVPLLKEPKVVIEQTILNCGPYPLNTWLNHQPVFTSQMDEIAKGTHIMDGLYQLEQSETGETIKNFSREFEPPEDSEKVLVVRFSECSPLLQVVHEDDVAMLKATDVSLDDFNGLIVVINQKIGPYRQKLVFQFKLLMGYIILGMLLLSIFAVLLGVFVSYWISLGLIVVYFIGLLVIQRITARN